MTVRQSNALFLLVVGLLAAAVGVMAWGNLTNGWSISWVWVFAPLWVPVAVWGVIMFLYQWERGLLPWQR